MPAYRVLGKTVLPLLRWRIRTISGLENIPTDGGFIVVANHQSWIDSAIVAGAIYHHLGKSLRFVAQSSKYRLFGGIPINEYDKSKVIDIAAGYIASGHPVAIFPEGNSNKNPELRGGKTGAARLALRSGAPVIPVGIQGTSGVKAWQSLLWFFSFWRPCQVVIGPPVRWPKTVMTDVDHDELMRVTNGIMEQISVVSGKPFDPNRPPAWMEPSNAFLERLIWKIVFPLMKWRVRVRGVEHLPPSGPYIIVGNHSSYFDPGALMIAVLSATRRRPFFLTKESIARMWRRILGPNAWTALGMLPINNQDKTQVIRSAESHLQHDGIVGIFPEATRNKPRLNPNWQTHLLKGKTGAARLALATHVPVIPAGIDAPRGLSILQTILSTLKFWHPVRVTFGSPVEFGPTPNGEPTHDDLATMTRAMMIRIADLSGMKYEH